MTYTLTLCLGMFLKICGSYKEYEYPTKQECLEARTQVSIKTIGDGYAVCAPTKKDEVKK